ncbi:MAG: four helix bundle protein [Candidatus Pacebacteria bacterium]|nr:four helix bundle protein [Candidatus Paceibacterota bacterium]MBP9772647.1 four helix bundle protein [Candidatus Paceibacterota bacterium]
MYQTGNKLTKRDKLGLHKNIEHETSLVLTYILRASFESRQKKLETLETSRVSVEVLKQLVRAEYELKIIDEKNYIKTQDKLQTISKEINGWIKYLKTQNPA